MLTKEKIASGLLLLIAAWTLFYRLDAVPMNLWDESRQANNALEMYLSGNWFYSTYDFRPDDWNTKPHLLIVLQALTMKLTGGPSLLALRLPSAIAGFLTIWVWFSFIYRRHGYTMAAFWTFIILSCGGFNVYHITRTGDYDALLTLFISLTNISLFRIFTGKVPDTHFRIAACWLSLAFLAKSMAIFLWIPAWLVLWILFKKYRNFKATNWISGTAILLVTITMYWGWQEYLNPGYLKALSGNDITGRYFAANEGHGFPWWYYFSTLWNDYFKYFTAALPLILLIPGIKTVRKELTFAMVASTLFIILLSFSHTRIWWYLAPVIPILAYWVSLPLAKQVKSSRIHFILAVGFIVAGIPGYYLNYHKNTSSHGVRPALVLMNAEKNAELPFDAYWQTAGYYPIEKYYKQVFASKRINLKLKQEFGGYRIGDTIIVSHMEHLDSLGRYYRLKQHHYPDESMPVWVMVVASPKAIFSETEKP